jgi:hypothetical protein
LFSDIEIERNSEREERTVRKEGKKERKCKSIGRP